MQSQGPAVNVGYLLTVGFCFPVFLISVPVMFGHNCRHDDSCGRICGQSTCTQGPERGCRPGRVACRAWFRRAFVPGRRGAGACPAPRSSTNMYGPGQGARAARDLHRRCQEAQRGADHVLLFGRRARQNYAVPPSIASRAGREPAPDQRSGAGKTKDLAALLTNLEPNDVLFIDEIPLPEPGGRGNPLPGAGGLSDRHHDRRRSGCTLPSSSISSHSRWWAPPRAPACSPTRLRDRFGIVARLEFYTSEELSRIVRRSAGLLNAPIDAEGCFEIACAARAARRALPIACCAAVRDYADVKGDGRIHAQIADRALAMPRCGPPGFDIMDRKAARSRGASFRWRPGRPGQYRGEYRRGIGHHRVT